MAERLQLKSLDFRFCHLFMQTKMLRSYIDHLTVTAPSLDVGSKYIYDILGVAPSAGGEHANMGTHNRLLKLGDAVYLEVISVNPNMPKPSRPYLFGLDHVTHQTPARLATWVARTEDMATAAARSTEPLGKIEAMSRSGMDWLITLPEDGGLALDGVAPALIEWNTDVHPVARLPESGCKLVCLEAYHPDPVRVRKLVESIGLEDDYPVYQASAQQPPHLVAYIQTPSGLRLLSLQS